MIKGIVKTCSSRVIRVPQHFFHSSSYGWQRVNNRTTEPCVAVGAVLELLGAVSWLLELLGAVSWLLGCKMCGVGETKQFENFNTKNTITIENN